MKNQDAFAADKIAGEYEKPGPKMDSDAEGIAKALSKLKSRASTGVVLNWLPPWAAKANVNAFSFYFFEDKLVVDSFSRDRVEMSALDEDFTQAQRDEIANKTVLCQKNKISYLTLGPDDELDMTQLAAKLNKTTYKKGAHQRSKVAAGRDMGDGISEEELP